MLHSKGISDKAYQATDVEIAFAIDASIAANIGGADVWSDGVRGETMLRWRMATPSTIAAVLNKEVLNDTSLESWSRRVRFNAMF